MNGINLIKGMRSRSVFRCPVSPYAVVGPGLFVLVVFLVCPAAALSQAVKTGGNYEVADVLGVVGSAAGGGGEYSVFQSAGTGAGYSLSAGGAFSIRGGILGVLDTMSADTTAPYSVPFLYDGLSGDVDVTFSTTTLSANWGAASDAQSGIAAYWYSIGTAPGASNTSEWTGAGAATTTTRSGLSLSVGETYFFTVKAQNGEGLFSATATSDGVKVEAAPAVWLRSGWNHTGVTRTGFEFSTETVFGGGYYDIVYRQGGEYAQLGGGPGVSLEFARCYWIYSDVEIDETPEAGSDFAGVSYQYSFDQAGWGQITCPFPEAVQWGGEHAALECGGEAAVLANVYAYGGHATGYETVKPGSGAKLHPWRAYWIYLHEDGCVLTISR